MQNVTLCYMERGGGLGQPYKTDNYYFFNVNMTFCIDFYYNRQHKIKMNVLNKIGKCRRS